MRIHSLNMRAQKTFKGPVWFIESIEELIEDVNKTYISMGVELPIVYAVGDTDSWLDDWITVYCANECILAELETQLEEAF